ncbi:MAG: hypothetical protein JOZ05_09105 [Acetobacteraceae bacterium]|nr:hypothetical protein [Acetobacteraceae bacterium]
MLLKLAALGTLAYVGYKYLEKNGGLSAITGAGSGDASNAAAEPDLSDPHVAIAGGPLSSDATLVSGGEPLPAA